MRTLFTDSDEAVSEMVDFIIILSIMVLATGVIVVAGMPILEDKQNVQHTENIKQTFEVLALNMNKVVHGNAPSQSVEMKMYGGTLSVAGDNYVEIELGIWNSSAGYVESHIAVGSMVKRIEHEFQGITVSYENTGVWTRSEDGPSVMVSEPHFAYANNMMIIPISEIWGTSSISSSSLLRINADGGTKIVSTYDNVSQVNITIRSDNFQSWARYLNEGLRMPIVMEDNHNKTVSVSKQYDNITVYVCRTPMTVTIN